MTYWLPVAWWHREVNFAPWDLIWVINLYSSQWRDTNSFLIPSELWNELHVLFVDLKTTLQIKKVTVRHKDS